VASYISWLAHDIAAARRKVGDITDRAITILQETLG
jgi:hypothetical protein